MLAECAVTYRRACAGCIERSQQVVQASGDVLLAASCRHSTAAVLGLLPAANGGSRLCPYRLHSRVSRPLYPAIVSHAPQSRGCCGCELRRLPMTNVGRQPDATQTHQHVKPDIPPSISRPHHSFGSDTCAYHIHHGAQTDSHTTTPPRPAHRKRKEIRSPTAPVGSQWTAGFGRNAHPSHQQWIRRDWY